MPDKLRSLKYYTLFGFFVIGIVTVLLGQVLPILSLRLGLNDAQAGAFFLALFGGSLFGTLSATTLARRLGFVRTSLIGIAPMIIGIPGLNLHDFTLCWIAIFLYGIGLGITIPAINLLTIEINPPERQSAAINLINFAWGIGAIVCQPFVAAVSGGSDLLAVTAILSAALCVLALMLFISGRDELLTQEKDLIDDVNEGLWSRPVSWLFIVFGFFVIGIESGLSGWLTTYTDSLTGAASPPINLTVVFFSFLVIGRGVASALSVRFRENILITFCTAALLFGISILVFDERFASVGAAIAGLGSSAIFPTNMVRFTKAFGATATRRSTPLFIAGIFGSASISWLIGVVSTENGGLRSGLGVLLIAALTVLVLQAAIVAALRRNS